MAAKKSQKQIKADADAQIAEAEARTAIARARKTEAEATKAEVEAKKATGNFWNTISNIVFVLVCIAVLVLAAIVCLYVVRSGASPAKPSETVALVMPTATREPIVELTATSKPEATATAEPTATSEPAKATSANEPAKAISDPSWPEKLFRSPVLQTDVFNIASAWIVAEPGVICDDSTLWTVGQTNTAYYQNVPEGAFAYFSLGQGNIAIDGVNLMLAGEKGLNYLVIMRGRIDDGIVDSDLNTTAEVTKFVLGHATWAFTPNGAYVSKNWFYQQMIASTTGGFTNCGATGCSRLKIVLFDVDSHYYQLYEVQAADLANWKLVEAIEK